MDLLYILIPVIVGLFCGIIGYILGKKNTKRYDTLAASIQADLDVCQIHAKNLNTKLGALEAELADHAKVTVTAPKSFLGEVDTLPFDSESASNVLGKKIKQDDLKIVEGIGPKIEVLLNGRGIITWYDLSQSTTEELQSILDAGGENYAIHNPSTWPKQALFAYQSKWLELKELQENLLGGKE